MKDKMIKYWQVGSKLVDFQRMKVYYWVVTDIDFEKEEVELDAYLKKNNKFFDTCGWYMFDEVDIMLDALKVKPTRLAKKIYPNAKEEDGWLIIEN